MSTNSNSLQNRLSPFIGGELTNELLNQLNNLGDTFRVIYQPPYQSSSHPVNDNRSERSGREEKVSDSNRSLSHFSGSMLDIEPKWPAINVVECDNSLRIAIEVPGMKPEDITLEFKDDYLIVHGEHRDEKRDDNEQRHIYERRYGTFFRQIPVFRGSNQNNICAKYENGMLYITVPKPVETNSYRIPIRTNDHSVSDATNT